jgi:hypothetical protein
MRGKRVESLKGWVEDRKKASKAKAVPRQIKRARENEENGGPKSPDTR